MNPIRIFNQYTYQIIHTISPVIIIAMVISLTVGCGKQTEMLAVKKVERKDEATATLVDKEENASYIQLGTTKIRSEGASEVKGENTAKAKELARYNALRKAVESQLDSLVALSIAEAKTVKAKFTNNPNRYVATFQMVRESVDSGVSLIVLDVEVLTGRIIHELIESGFLAKLKQKPSLTIAISETLNDKPSTSPFFATELTKIFLGYGFKVHEQTLSHKDVQSILQTRSQENHVEVAKPKFNTDVVIIGQAEGKTLPEKIGKYTSCRVNVVMKAISNETSEILAAETSDFAGLGPMEADAMRDSTKHLAPKADFIAKSIVRRWAPAVYSGKMTPHVDQTASKPPQITIHAPDDKSVTSYESILLRGMVEDDKTVSNVKILHNGSELALTKDLHIVSSQESQELKFRQQTTEDIAQINRSISLIPGQNVIDLIAYDADNNRTKQQIIIFRNTSEANQLITIHSPTNSEIIAQKFVHLRGEIKDTPSDLQIKVNGETLPVKKDLRIVPAASRGKKSFRFDYQIPLTQAKNIIGIIAFLPNDGKLEKYLTVFSDKAVIQSTDFSEPRIVIYSPSDREKTSAPVIRLQGEIITTETIATITIENNGMLSNEIENPAFVEYDAVDLQNQGIQRPMTYEIDQELKLQMGENKIQLTVYYGVSKKLEKQLTITLHDSTEKLPQIVIQSPKDGAIVTTNLIRLNGYVANASVSEIMFWVNGVELAAPRDINLVQVKPKDKGKITHSIDRQIPLSTGTNVIKVVASTNAGKLTAERIIITELGDELSLQNFNKYAVIIGIGKYEDTSIRALKYAAKDAEEMYKFLINPAHGNFPAGNVKKLINEEATSRNIKSAIGTWLPQNVKQGDMVILFYSGHGGVELDQFGEEVDGKSKYIIPYDAQADDLFATALLNSLVSTMLDRVTSNRMVFFIDCCYSGGVTDNISSVKTISKPSLQPNTNVYGQLAGRSRVVIAASQPDEVSFEVSKYEHGVFTYYLLKGLHGEADSNKDSNVTLFEIFPYLSINVPISIPGKLTQNPVLMGTIVGDIILAKVGN